MNYPNRLDLLRRQLKKLRCDALVITHLTNVRYLTGFTGSSGLVVVTPDTNYFVTDFRYRTQAALQTGDHCVIAIADKGLWREAAKTLKKLEAERIGFEAEHTSVASWSEIKELVQPASTVQTAHVVEDLRLIKDADEIVILREAARVADVAFEAALAAVRPGMAERDIAAIIEAEIRAQGGSGTSFDSVASGIRSALPHGIASDKLIEKGDMVTIDMGAKFDGYCSDMTRTVCVGPASNRHKEIYALTLEAQVTASAALRPGLACKAADAIARRVIDDAGFKENFGHGLGHGVGMDIHEQPRLSKLGTGKLAAGMIVTSEPGIYIPDWGGVRIEDMLLITAEGAEILTGVEKPGGLLEV